MDSPMNADFFYANESSYYQKSYESDYEAPCACRNISQMFDDSDKKQVEMFQLTESALDGGFLNKMNEVHHTCDSVYPFLQECDDSMSPELYLTSQKGNLLSKTCSFFEHNYLNNESELQDRFHLSNHIDQFLAVNMKIEEPLIEDKGHCSTKDHSFHYDKEELSFIMEQYEVHPPHQQDQRENVPNSAEDAEKDQDPMSKTKAIKKQKHRHHISKCGHEDMPYYANGMCQNCYHAKGRTKKATKCEHQDRPLYAKGICKNCYLSIYHKKKRSELKTTTSSVSSTSAASIIEEHSTPISPKLKLEGNQKSPRNQKISEAV